MKARAMINEMLVLLMELSPDRDRRSVIKLVKNLVPPVVHHGRDEAWWFVRDLRF